MEFPTPVHVTLGDTGVNSLPSEAFPTQTFQDSIDVMSPPWPGAHAGDSHAALGWRGVGTR